MENHQATQDEKVTKMNAFQAYLFPPSPGLCHNDMVQDADSEQKMFAFNNFAVDRKLRM